MQSVCTEYLALILLAGDWILFPFLADLHLQWVVLLSYRYNSHLEMADWYIIQVFYFYMLPRMVIDDLSVKLLQGARILMWAEFLPVSKSTQLAVRWRECECIFCCTVVQRGCLYWTGVLEIKLRGWVVVEICQSKELCDSIVILSRVHQGGGVLVVFTQC